MKHITNYRTYNIWQSEVDGHFEAWKSKKIIEVEKNGTKTAKDLDRIVLVATNEVEAMNEIDAKLKAKKMAKKKNKVTYDPYVDPLQTRIEQVCLLLFARPVQVVRGLWGKEGDGERHSQQTHAPQRSSVCL